MFITEERHVRVHELGTWGAVDGRWGRRGRQRRKTKEEKREREEGGEREEVSPKLLAILVNTQFCLSQWRQHLFCLRQNNLGSKSKGREQRCERCCAKGVNRCEQMYPCLRVHWKERSCPPPSVPTLILTSQGF